MAGLIDQRKLEKWRFPKAHTFPAGSTSRGFCDLPQKLYHSSGTIPPVTQASNTAAHCEFSAGFETGNFDDFFYYER